LAVGLAIGRTSGIENTHFIFVYMFLEDFSVCLAEPGIIEERLVV